MPIRPSIKAQRKHLQQSTRRVLQERPHENFRDLIDLSSRTIDRNMSMLTLNKGKGGGRNELTSRQRERNRQPIAKTNNDIPNDIRINQRSLVLSTKSQAKQMDGFNRSVKVFLHKPSELPSPFIKTSPTKPKKKSQRREDKK